MMVRAPGQHLITWAQTQVDGAMADPNAPLAAGSTWRWFGVPIRIDGPQATLLLGNGLDDAAIKSRAAHVVQKLAKAQGMTLPHKGMVDGPMLEGGFIVADGGRFYSVLPINGVDPTGPLLLFPEGVPPVNKPLTIVESDTPKKKRLSQDTGVICFTPGTLLRTQMGEKRVEDLFPGDVIQTKDNGLQEIIWMGLRQISGARMYMDTSLRPIRIRAGALGAGGPQPDLVVSPDHRVLLQGKNAEMLFGTPEVLARAADLVDDRKILVDHAATEVVYFHLMFAQHEVIWANGVETESFHPGSAALEHLSDVDREDLMELVPGVDSTPDIYGPHARRCLSHAELAILRHESPPHYLT